MFSYVIFIDFIHFYKYTPQVPAADATFEQDDEKKLHIFKNLNIFLWAKNDKTKHGEILKHLWTVINIFRIERYTIKFRKLKFSYDPSAVLARFQIRRFPNPTYAVLSLVPRDLIPKHKKELLWWSGTTQRCVSYLYLTRSPERSSQRMVQGEYSLQWASLVPTNWNLVGISLVFPENNCNRN